MFSIAFEHKMNSRIIQLVEELKHEVSLAEIQVCNDESLKIENDTLKQQLVHSKATIHELKNKLEQIEKENVLLTTHKRKLKLVVIKLKRKLETKNIEKRGLNRVKSKKVDSEIFSNKIDVICINDETSNECNFDFEVDKSPRSNGNFSTKSSPTEQMVYPDASDRIKMVLEKISTLNPRKKQDRSKMETKPCEQCVKWYGDSIEHMKDTCRHRYHAIPPSTPENYWNFRFPSSQSDS